MKFLDHRQKRTGWLLIAISGGYLVWFLKVRLLTAGLPIEKKEWFYFAAMVSSLAFPSRIAACWRLPRAVS